MARTIPTLLADIWAMLLRLCGYWLIYLLISVIGAILGGGGGRLPGEPWREVLALHLVVVLVIAVVLGILRPWLVALPGAIFAGAIVLPLLFALSIPVLQPQISLWHVAVFSLAAGLPLGAIYGAIAWIAHRRATRALK